MDGPTIVAATSGVLGAVVGVGATLLVARNERRASLRAELVAALAAFLTALDLIVMELKATAPPRPWLGALSRWLNRSRPEVGWLVYQQVLDMGGPAPGMLERVLGSTVEEAFAAWSGRGVSGLNPDSAEKTLETGRPGERPEH
jgi:hypothetical protein